MPKTQISPEKALLLYSSSVPESASLTPHIHQLVSRGCCGRLTLEQHADSKARPSALDNLHEILGTFGCTSTEQMKANLSKRFGKLKLGLISTSADAVAWAESVGLFYTQRIDNNTTPEALLSTVLDTVAPGAPVDCLIVDASDLDTARSWKRLDVIVQACLDHTPHLYKSVLSQAEVHAQARAARPWDGLIPLQSATVKDGNPVQVNDTYAILTASLHDGTTRRDTTQLFETTEIVSKGCNSATLAYHFLLEIGHKLGYVPKYGA